VLLLLLVVGPEQKPERRPGPPMTRLVVRGRGSRERLTEAGLDVAERDPDRVEPLVDIDIAAAPANLISFLVELVKQPAQLRVEAWISDVLDGSLQLIEDARAVRYPIRGALHSRHEQVLARDQRGFDSLGRPLRQTQSAHSEEGKRRPGRG
jgi:pimeloyl-ACP methyl ester carboxylesterase